MERAVFAREGIIEVGAESHLVVETDLCKEYSVGLSLRNEVSLAQNESRLARASACKRPSGRIK